jgi:hypothetical protein
MHEVIAFDQSCLEEDNCITRRGGGLIDWSDSTIEKLDKSKPAGAKMIKEKQIALFLNMLQLTYELMMLQALASGPLPSDHLWGRQAASERVKSIPQVDT